MEHPAMLVTTTEPGASMLLECMRFRQKIIPLNLFTDWKLFMLVTGTQVPNQFTSIKCWEYISITISIKSTHNMFAF